MKFSVMCKRGYEQPILNRNELAYMDNSDYLCSIIL